MYATLALNNLPTDYYMTSIFSQFFRSPPIIYIWFLNVCIPVFTAFICFILFHRYFFLSLVQYSFRCWFIPIFWFHFTSSTSYPPENMIANKKRIDCIVFCHFWVNNSALYPCKSTCIILFETQILKSQDPPKKKKQQQKYHATDSNKAKRMTQSGHNEHLTYLTLTSRQLNHSPFRYWN